MPDQENPSETSGSQTSARSSHDDGEESDGSRDTESTHSTAEVQVKKVNPRLHLLHNGTWIPKRVSGVVSL